MANNPLGHALGAAASRLGEAAQNYGASRKALAQHAQMREIDHHYDTLGAQRDHELAKERISHQGKEDRKTIGAKAGADIATKRAAGADHRLTAQQMHGHKLVSADQAHKHATARADQTHAHATARTDQAAAHQKSDREHAELGPLRVAAAKKAAAPARKAPAKKAAAAPKAPASSVSATVAKKAAAAKKAP